MSVPQTLYTKEYMISFYDPHYFCKQKTMIYLCHPKTLNFELKFVLKYKDQ